MNKDNFALWELIVSTHLYSSGRTRNRQMTELILTKQTDTHEEFLSFVHEQAALVLGAFGSLVYPSYIKFDDVLKSAYLNGVDQVFFQRLID